jgi:hypothetical protein
MGWADPGFRSAPPLGCRRAPRCGEGGSHVPGDASKGTTADFGCQSPAVTALDQDVTLVTTARPPLFDPIQIPLKAHADLTGIGRNLDRGLPAAGPADHQAAFSAGHDHHRPIL